MISWRNPGRRIAKSPLTTIASLVCMPRDKSEILCRAGKFMRWAIALAGHCCRLLPPRWRATATPVGDRSPCAAQTDFTEAGELTLFINESQVAFLEDMMWERGVLDTTQMAGAFQLLRSNDLIWSSLHHDYLMGEQRRPAI